MLVVWDASTGAAVRVVRHEGPVQCAAFSPDGARIASGFEDPRGVLEYEAYAPLDVTDDPLPPEVDELLGDYTVSREWDLDPETSDGVALSIRVSDSETGERAASFYSERLRSYPTAVDWSPDGRWLISASGDGLVVWQVRTASVFHILDVVSVVAASFSFDGRSVAAAGSSGWLVWDHTTNRVLHEGGRNRSDDVADDYTDVAWSPDGLIALGTEEGTVEVVSPSRATVRELEGHTRRITGVSFSADGHVLATKSLDGTVRLWSSETWEALSVLREPARGQSPVAGVAFSPRGTSLVTLGSAGRIARVWDLHLPTIAARRDVAPTTHYANAKIGRQRGGKDGSRPYPLGAAIHTH
jgi:WD40 repeat protein